MRSAGPPGFSTEPHGRSTRNTWNGSPQRELTTKTLSGKLGADHGHLRAMLARTSAHNRAELVARAYAAGVLTTHSWPPRWSGRRCLTMPAIRDARAASGAGHPALG